MKDYDGDLSKFSVKIIFDLDCEFSYLSCGLSYKLFIHRNINFIIDKFFFFKLNPKKPYDPAQRWRTLKNITRFLKNPIGYTFWRYYYAKNIGNASSF
jgi:hypothetical protein